MSQGEMHGDMSIVHMTPFLLKCPLYLFKFQLDFAWHLTKMLDAGMTFHSVLFPSMTSALPMQGHRR